MRPSTSKRGPAERETRFSHPFPDATPTRSHGVAAAFTLLELLVVLAIIGILAAISLPAMKGITKSNTMANANRQLLDDIALARQIAIKNRTTVHILFVPTNMMDMTFAPASPKIQKLGERLRSGQFTSYALFADRSVGDQPGQPHPHYLTSWRTLPDGVFIAEGEFNELSAAAWNLALNTPETRPFKYADFPFPTVDSELRRIPHLAFDAKGGLPVPSDEYITIARGSILYQRADNGTLLSFDVRESPPGNSVDNPNRIRIDHLTGRAKVERLEIQ